MGFDSRAAPVNVGEVLEVTIDGVGGKGDGIARVKGFVIFVPKAKQGQRLRVKIVKVLSKVGFAEVVQSKQRHREPSASASSAPVVDEAPPVEEAEPEPLPEPDPNDSENFGEEPDMGEYL